MSKVTCNVIKDVLPLYVDGILSDDTSRIVAEHLEQCSECKKTYEDMKSAVVIPVDNDVTPLKNFQKAWKKKIISRVCAAILIAVAIMCCARFMPTVMWNLTAIFVAPLLVGAVIRVFLREFSRAYIVTIAAAIMSIAAFVVFKNPPILGSELYFILMMMSIQFTIGSFIVGAIIRITGKKR